MKLQYTESSKRNKKYLQGLVQGNSVCFGEKRHKKIIHYYFSMPKKVISILMINKRLEKKSLFLNNVGKVFV